MNFMCVKKFLRVFLAFLLFIGGTDLHVLAETIKLKRGDVVEGTITKIDFSMIYFRDKATNKPMKVRKSKVESIDGIPISEWKKSGKELKKIISVNKKIKSSTRSELNLKVGLDFNGENSYSSESSGYYYRGTLYSWNLSANADVKNGISMTGEYVGFINRSIGIGAGITYQVSREEEDYAGEFSFMPIYGLIKFRFADSINYPYLVGQLGYNIFEADDDFTMGGGSLENGTYYGLGGGITFKNDFILEFLYSVHKGKFKSDVYNLFPSDFAEFDVEYKTYRLNIGYRFNLDA